MRGFLIVAVGAVALAGCAPFEHGHYANDVKYVNTAGDPSGTPLVFSSDWKGDDYRPAESTYVASNDNWSKPSRHHGRRHYRHEQPSYSQTAYAAPTSYTPTASYSAPVSYEQSYTAPQTSYAQPVAYAQPSYAAPAYAPASTQTYSATSLGGVQIDADGYAICNETYPQGSSHIGHAAHAPHGYSRTY